MWRRLARGFLRSTVRAVQEFRACPRLRAPFLNLRIRLARLVLPPSTPRLQKLVHLSPSLAVHSTVRVPLREEYSLFAPQISWGLSENLEGADQSQGQHTVSQR